MANDVVVTGLGAATPVGETAAATWAALRAGESGAGPVTRFDAAEYEQCPDLACEVERDPTATDPVDPRRMGRYAQYAVAATADALADASLSPEDSTWTPERVGTSVGTGIGGTAALLEASRTLHEGGRFRSRRALRAIPNLAAGHVSVRFDAAGPSRAPATACAAGTHAVADAVADLRAGRADVMLAGGTEACLCPTLLAAFGSLRALSTRTDEPTAASRPFDEDRDGFVMAEGAGVLVLETESHARERGADPLARVAGAGRSADAHHPTRPPEDASGLSRAMDLALADAGRSPAEVDCVSAHGTSTPSGDAHEAHALGRVFDEVPPVTAPKSALGHSLGACGAIEAVLAVQSVRDGTIPPTINCESRDPDCAVPVVTEPTEAALDVVVSNTAGFGGTNGVLVLEAVA